MSAAKSPDGRGSSRSSRKKQPAYVVHVHLREKVIDVNAGAGNQQVFWLAVNAVQRYVLDHKSYTHAFSDELTPRGVLSEDLQWLPNNGTIRDELSSGDHVWIDVGDGVPISDVRSRPFGSYQQSRANAQQLWQRVNQEIFSEVILWEANNEDNRPAMVYSRTEKGMRMSFDQWKVSGELPFTEDVSSEDGEDLWIHFNRTWKALDLSDLPAYPDWTQEVKAMLFKHFEQLAYIFICHAAKSNDYWLMSLLEFWTFCKQRKIPTRYLNMAKIDLMFVTIDSKSQAEHEPHNPKRVFIFREFIEGIVRLSVARQKNPRNPDVPLPQCLEDFLIEHVLDDQGEWKADQKLRADLSSARCRRVYEREQKALTRIFNYWARLDQNNTMSMDEWLAMFKASELMDHQGLQRRQLVRSFVHAQLDEDEVDEEHKDVDDTCQTLIYPEFEEALGRAALAKFDADELTPTEAKLHEFIELLIASKAGYAASARGTAEEEGGTSRRYGRRSNIASMAR